MEYFISGVVEGFYGRPWTSIQRNELFKRLQTFELNTFLYGPKDDLKHRQLWRVLYSDEEEGQLKCLILNCKKYNVDFVYAISPGLDIEFSNSDEINALKRKLDQLANLGCESFALLFDDIDPNLSDNDRQHYRSPAAAQVDISNKIFQYTKNPRIFLFCPTEYCDRQTNKSTVLESEYLNIIGEGLNEGINILWTGPKVVSNQITNESIKDVVNVLRRPPVIWDNIHANDYDLKRVFLGPFSGRPVELINSIRGILTNPNCEFEANFVPIHTMAQWIKCGLSNTITNRYNPTDALTYALKDWIKHIYEDTNNQDHNRYVEQGNTAGIEGSNSNHSSKSQLSIDDLTVITHLFYLPYEHGTTAIQLLDDIYWLKQHEYILDYKEMCEPLVQDWHSRADKFLNDVKKIRSILDNFLNIPNRDVLYDLYQYNRNIQYICGMLTNYVKWMSREPNFECTLMDNTKDHEPWIHKGGLSSELEGCIFTSSERLIPTCGARDMHKNTVQHEFMDSQFHHNVAANQDDGSVYLIRQYDPIEDKENLYQFILTSFYLAQAISPAKYFDDHPLKSLPGDIFISHWLKLASDTFYLLVDEDDAILGYTIGTSDIELLYNYSQTAFVEEIASKYNGYFNEYSEIGGDSLVSNCAFKKLYESVFVKDSLNVNVLEGAGIITIYCQKYNVNVFKQLIKTISRHMKKKNPNLQGLISKMQYWNSDQWKILDCCGFKVSEFLCSSNDNVGNAINQDQDNVNTVFYVSLPL